MPKRILVVDDDPDTVKLLAAAFRKWGFEVETALNGAEGIKVIDRVPVNGMTLGIRMPQVNGYEFMRYLRQRDLKMPVIIISGWALSLNKADEQDAYLMNNVQALFPKPVSSDELKPAVDRWFGYP